MNRKELEKSKTNLDHLYAKAIKGNRKSDPIEKEILEGIPRGVWSNLWATEQEEKGRSFSGQDITQAAPKTPTWAKTWAKDLSAKIVSDNSKTLAELFQYVKENGYPYDAVQFGLHLGMQAVGHGVSWSDDTKLPHSAIKIQHKEFYR